MLFWLIELIYCRTLQDLGYLEKEAIGPNKDTLCLFFNKSILLFLGDADVR